MRATRWILGACLAMAACGAMAATNAELKQQVGDTERAFAASMQTRDFAAFSSFLSEDAVFFSDSGPTTGKAAVMAVWKRYFANPVAPFAWAPDQVEVLASGTLASSSGPVFDAKGKLIARFHSIWRLEEPGKWRIVFDRGEDVCDCKKP